MCLHAPGLGGKYAPERERPQTETDSKRRTHTPAFDQALNVMYRDHAKRCDHCAFLGVLPDCQSFLRVLVRIMRPFFDGSVMGPWPLTTAPILTDRQTCSQDFARPLPRCIRSIRLFGRPPSGARQPARDCPRHPFFRRCLRRCLLALFLNSAARMV